MPRLLPCPEPAHPRLPLAELQAVPQEAASVQGWLSRNLIPGVWSPSLLPLSLPVTAAGVVVCRCFLPMPR